MLGKNKNKLLSYWGKNNKILSLKREANNLINVRKQIITGEYKYRSVISKLSKIKMIIEMVEYYKPCIDTKKLDIKFFINTTKNWVCISYHKKPLLKNQSHDKEMVLKC